MLAEAIRELNLINKTKEYQLKTINCMFETAISAEALKLEKKELDYLTEGTEITEDIETEMFTESVKEGAAAAIKSIKSIAATVKEFFQKLIVKISTIFKKKENTDKLDELENLSKKSIFRGKKVKIVNPEAEQTVIAKHIAKLKEFLRRLKSGKEVSKEEFDEEKQRYSTALKGALVATAVAIPTAILLARKLFKRAEKDASTYSKDSDKTLLEAANFLDKEFNLGTKGADTVRTCQALADSYTRYGNTAYSGPMKIMQDVRKFLGIYKKPGELPYNESGDADIEDNDDFMSYYESALGIYGNGEEEPGSENNDELHTESGAFDLKNAFNSIFGDMFEN